MKLVAGILSILAAIQVSHAQSRVEVSGIGSVVKLIPLAYIQLLGRIQNANQNSQIALIGSVQRGTSTSYIFSVNSNFFAGVQYDPSSAASESVRAFSMGSSLQNVLSGLGHTQSELSQASPSQNYALDFLQNHPLSVVGSSSYFVAPVVMTQPLVVTQTPSLSFPQSTFSVSQGSSPTIRSSYSGNLIQGLNTVNNVYANPSIVSTQDQINYFYDPTTGSLIQSRTPQTGSVSSGPTLASRGPLSSGNVVGVYGTSAQGALGQRGGLVSGTLPSGGLVSTATGGRQVFQPSQTSQNTQTFQTIQNIQTSQVPQTSQTSQVMTAQNLEILSRIPPAALDRLQSDFPNLSRIDIANLLANDATALNALGAFSAQSAGFSTSSSSQSSQSASQNNAPISGQQTSALTERVTGYFYPDLSDLA